jgi:hypothetical protein
MPMLHGLRIEPFRALGLAALLATAACAAQSPRFYTEVPQPGALTAGSPVVNLGSAIGSVVSVSTLADGNAGVAFDIDPADLGAIRRGSIMVVRDDPGGASLDLMTTDPSSPPASPGTQIDGASNQTDANALVAAKNLAASAPAMAMIASAPGGNAAIANMSPAWLALQQQILALQTQALIAGTTSTVAVTQQLNQINQSAGALERQMVAAGNSVQADQLRRQIEALTNSLTTPPAGLLPPTGSGSFYGTTPSSAGTPPASGAPAPTAPSSGTLVIPPTR